MKTNKLLLYLCIALACIISAFLTTLQHTKAPVCLNADEAAFGYTAYSLLKTGRDEYGALLPLRLKSFGDYKMPLYSYLSVPFIQVFGLTEQGARAANVLIALVLPLAIFLLAKEFFESTKSALAATFIGATSMGLHIIARQAHEAYLAAFITTLCTYFFLKLIKKPTTKLLVPYLIAVFFLLLSYQSSRLFALFYIVVFVLYICFKKAKRNVLLIAIAATALFLLPDTIYQPARVGNLLFFKSAGLGMKTHELRTEGGNALLYNKATVAAHDFVANHLEYYSPEFLIKQGDLNYRFGFTDISIVTAVEYLLAIAGMYYLFKNGSRYRYTLGGLLLISPLAGSLTWADISLSRTLFLVVLISLLAGHGFAQIIDSKNRNKNRLLLMMIVSTQLILLAYSWDIYLNHYPKRAIVIRASQCGYKDLAQYIKNRYDNVSSIYISPKNGQPYIFQLFYSRYNPGSYQKKATLSQSDEYGFGQVVAFDKYKFNFPSEPPKNSIIVGYPDDFIGRRAYEPYLSNVQKITIGTEEIFWILQTP